MHKKTINLQSTNSLQPIAYSLEKAPQGYFFQGTYSQKEGTYRLFTVPFSSSFRTATTG